MINYNMNVILFMVLGLLFVSCEKTEDPIDQLLPLTDPDNTGNWVLNKEVSDEFEGDVLDEEKWLIQGRNGEYKSNFIGRAPSQFSTENVRLEDGKMKIQTKWDPDFDFSPTFQEYNDGSKYYYENITTAAIITKESFRYGYMEIKAKITDASVSSAFWLTGSNSELDIFESVGKPKQSQKIHLEKEMKTTIHDWSSAGGGAPTWSVTNDLPFRMADDFHIYACEWDENNLKIYADGELLTHVSRQELGDGWTIKGKMWIWFDVETFPWHGIPVEADLPQDFEVEYLRVWQKEEQ